MPGLGIGVTTGLVEHGPAAFWDERVQSNTHPMLESSMSCSLSKFEKGFLFNGVHNMSFLSFKDNTALPHFAAEVVSILHQSVIHLQKSVKVKPAKKEEVVFAFGLTAKPNKEANHHAWLLH